MTSSFSSTLCVRTEFWDSGNLTPSLYAEHLLGAVYYGLTAPEHPEGLDPVLFVETKVKNTEGFYEMWISSGKTSRLRVGDFNLSMDGENLFGCISYPVSSLAGGLSKQTEDNYSKLFNILKELNYPCLFRMWNYVPQINQEDGLEKYKAFCLGRNNAFLRFYGTDGNVMPAATGIGKNNSEYVDLFFLAGRYPSMIHIENPRQTPAYRYPVKYGPKPPSFSRATAVVRSENKLELYVSGTASIIGSDTVFAGNLKGQCKTTLDNLTALLSPENLDNYQLSFPGTLADMDHIKVYYRQEMDLPVIREYCEKSFSNNSKIKYIHADICRKELLLEIEGSIQNIVLRGN